MAAPHCIENTNGHRGQAPQKECGWKYGDRGAEDHNRKQSKQGEERKRCEDDAEGEEIGWRARGTRVMRRCLKLRQGASPLRPRPPFPGHWIIRSGRDLSRVRKPAQTPPLTNLRRSEEVAMKRERGPLWTGAEQSASRWSADTKCLAAKLTARLAGAYEALPQTPPGGRPPETPKCA